MVSLVLTTRLVSERSASSTWDLMPRTTFGARHQIVAGLPAAAFDAAGDGLDARAEQVLEMRHAGVDDRLPANVRRLVECVMPIRLEITAVVLVPQVSPVRQPASYGRFPWAFR